MEKEKLLKIINEQIEEHERRKNVYLRNKTDMLRMAGDEDEDEDLADYFEIKAIYYSTVEDGSLRALEQLLALKERIERREE